MKDVERSCREMELKRKHNRLLQNMAVIGKHHIMRSTTWCSVPDILWGY